MNQYLLISKSHVLSLGKQLNTEFYPFHPHLPSACAIGHGFTVCHATLLLLMISMPAQYMLQLVGNSLSQGWCQGFWRIRQVSSKCPTHYSAVQELAHSGGKAGGPVKLP